MPQEPGDRRVAHPAVFQGADFDFFSMRNPLKRHYRQGDLLSLRSVVIGEDRCLERFERGTNF
jgi:hypothetical protein